MKKLPSIEVIFRRWLKKQRIGYKHFFVLSNDQGDIKVGAHYLASIKGDNYASTYDATGKAHPFAMEPKTVLNIADPDFFDKVKRHLRLAINGLNQHLDEVNTEWDKNVIGKSYHTEG